MALRAATGLIHGFAAALAVVFAEDPGAPDRPPAPPAPVVESESVREPPPTVAEIQAWVADLDSDEFSVREHAQQRLARAGLEAVALLERAAHGQSLEITGRAVRALGQIGGSGELPVFEAVQEALERLANSRNRSVARRAIAELDNLAEARTKHAIARFQELGGRMKRARSAIVGGVGANVLVESMRLQAVLNRNWKGGEAGLIHLTRISGLGTVYVTRSAGAMVSAEALEDLRRAVPDLQIQHRGDAMIGIVGQTQDGECIVHGIEEGSPAARAGLQKDDIIVRYNGEKLDGFDRLIEITRELKPGDRIKIDIVRRLQEQTVELDLADFE